MNISESLVVMEYTTTPRFRQIERHTAVARADGSLVAVTGPAGDAESEAYARRFAASSDLLVACKAFLSWYDGLLQEDEAAANEHTEWVGFCEFEALVGNDDDIYVTADDPELTAIAEQMRAAVAKARSTS